MDWHLILNEYVYPALFGLILILIAIGLKMLAAWLKTLTPKIQNDLLRSIVEDAVNGIEQAAANAEKAGGAKWASDKKKGDAVMAALEVAKAKGVNTTEAEVNKLIESVLGAKK